jgi:hypothetical protein
MHEKSQAKKYVSERCMAELVSAAAVQTLENVQKYNKTLHQKAAVSRA